MTSKPEKGLLSPIPADWLELYQAAAAARLAAFAPYSHFKVGAAVCSTSGQVYTGCNIENASYGLTVCAERVAIWKAVSSGEKDFTRLIVVSEGGSPPCGACRQVLYEFSPELTLLVANLDGRGSLEKLSDLLPHAFRLAR